MKRFALVLLLALASCEAITGKPTKTAAGELYQSGDARYDDYFKKVHDEQVAASSWAEESKAAKKPLTTALNLPLTAGNSSILSAAKAKKDDAGVKSAAAETASAEAEFAKKQKENAERLDKLTNDGAELKKQTIEERKNMAAEKADPAAVDKKEEVKREMSAAVDAAANMRDDAAKGAAEAEKLVDGLKKELGVSGEAAAPKPAPKKEEPKGEKPASAPKKESAKKPAAKPAPASTSAQEKPEKPAPAPKPAPTQQPAGEEFTP